MPNRILREGILESELVCSLPWAAEVLYRRLISVVDDYGRFPATPKLIRAKCYPLQIDKVSDSDIGKWLTQVVEAALVRVYPAQDGKRYLQVEKFGQQVRSRSKYPPPPDVCDQLLADAKQPIASAHLDVDVDVDVDEGGKGVRKRPPAFTPPTEEEVRRHCEAKGYHVDAVKFVAHYTSNGWMVGKARMRDWRAATVTWHKGDLAQGRANRPPEQPSPAAMRAL
jgi:hypothetical protein